MRKLFMILNVIWVNVAFCQESNEFILGEKKISSGYIIRFIEIRDTLNFEKNKLSYFFVEDEGFQNVEFNNSYAYFKDKRKDSIYQDVETHVIQLSEKLNSMALFRNYRAFYFALMKYDSNELSIMDPMAFAQFKKASMQVVWKDTNEVLKLFDWSPNVSRKQGLGIQYSIQKVCVEYLYVSWDNFEAFEKSFLVASSDDQINKLVGLGLVYAKLKGLDNYKNGRYPAMLPMRVLECK